MRRSHSHAGRRGHGHPQVRCQPKVTSAMLGSIGMIHGPCWGDLWSSLNSIGAKVWSYGKLVNLGWPCKLGSYTPAETSQ